MTTVVYYSSGYTLELWLDETSYSEQSVHAIGQAQIVFHDVYHKELYWDPIC